MKDETPEPCPFGDAQCGTEAIKFHPCPYAEKIYSVDKQFNRPCRCCDACQADCANF